MIFEPGDRYSSPGIKPDRQIDRNWETSPTFKHNLVYRVSVDSEGAIASYEPLNQLAKDYL